MKSNGSLRALIEQTKPFPNLETELIVSLQVTLDRALDVAHRPLRLFRLSREQYNVLRILRGAGGKGLPTHRVASRMVSREPNIARLVAKLEGKMLVRRNRSPRDGRIRTLRITPEGLRVLADLDGPIGASTERAVRGLDEKEIDTLLALLDKIRRPLVADGEPLPAPGTDGGTETTERRKQ